MSKASSPKPEDLCSVDCVSDTDEKDFSDDDDDDDRNHKHRWRDTQTQSQEKDQLEPVFPRPYRKFKKPFQNGHGFRDGSAQSNFNSNQNFSTKFDRRRPMGNHSQVSSNLDLRYKLNQSFLPENGRVRDNFWNPHDPWFSSVDVPPLMGDFQGASWNNFGVIPGAPNGAMNAIHPPILNLGVPRQRCIDFEERGFCLRGDMCPMEHGLNRIVIEDVQSLSQFNLPVSLPSAPLPGPSVGAGFVSSDGAAAAASGSFINSKSSRKTKKRRGDEDMFHLDDAPGGIDAGETDVYNPDQPLWNNDRAETSNSKMHPPKINDSESLMDGEPSGQLIRGNGAAVDLQKNVWGRVDTKKAKENFDSRMNSSYIPESKDTHVGVSGAKVAQDNIGRHVQKPSQKALRTLFVNFIPLKDNKRESLQAHFGKFGEVIDIYIPANSERAFVQFSKREEAEAALKAPDAVMGNRFIKLWWANRDRVHDKGFTSGSTSVKAWDVSNASVRPNSNAQGRQDSLSVSTLGADNLGTPYNDIKALPTNSPKPLPSVQKKLHSLALLEEIRKKQELLDQKRNEFRRQLLTLEKQATGTKGESPPEQTSKRLKVGISAEATKSESSTSAEPVASLGASMVHELVREPQIAEKCLSPGGEMDSASASLPESPRLKRAGSASASKEIEVSGANGAEAHSAEKTAHGAIPDEDASLKRSIEATKDEGEKEERYIELKGSCKEVKCLDH
ncbi:hypothetical protein Drorol1_Dr00021586 [Drosera rotundifolia]